MFHTVLDTNILFAALYSRRGSSYALVREVAEVEAGRRRKRRFMPHVSVPLVLEYEAVLRRERHRLGVSEEAIEAVVDLFCLAGTRHDIYFLWRGHTRDAEDAHVLEAAIAGRCSHLVTFNLRDFTEAFLFGIEALRPGDFLSRLGTGSA